MYILAAASYRVLVVAVDEILVYDEIDQTSLMSFEDGYRFTRHVDIPHSHHVVKRTADHYVQLATVIETLDSLLGGWWGRVVI